MTTTLLTPRARPHTARAVEFPSKAATLVRVSAQIKQVIDKSPARVDPIATGTL